LCVSATANRDDHDDDECDDDNDDDNDVRSLLMESLRSVLEEGGLIAIDP
jgi:hypothetical protein